MKHSTVLALIACLAAGCLVTRTDYVIPAGFTGPVVIVFNDPLGGPVQKAGFLHERYDIRPDGVLRLRTELVDRWTMDRFFYVDAQGRRTAIPLRGDAPANDKEVQILRMQDWSIPPDPTPLPGGGGFGTTEGGLSAIVFVVGRPIDFPDPAATDGEAAKKVIAQEYRRLRAAGLHPKH